MPPISRALHQIAWDANSNRMLLFGGYISSAPSGVGADTISSKKGNWRIVNGVYVANDLWQYIPSTGVWTQIADVNGNAPSAGSLTLVQGLADFGMAFFPTANGSGGLGALVVTCGSGWNGSAIDVCNERWIWYAGGASAGWQGGFTNLCISPARRGVRLLFDPRGNGAVWSFGGYDGTTFYNDMWTQDQNLGGWSKVNQISETPPSGRTQANFYYNASDQCLYVVGGWNASGVLTDTWKYDGSLTPGSRWVLVSANGAGLMPPGGVTYSPSEANPLQLGANVNSSGAVAATSLLTAGAWAAQTPVHSPTFPRTAFGMTTITTGLFHIPMIYSGVAFNGTTFYNDIWFWSNGDWTQTFPVASTFNAHKFNPSFQASYQGIFN